MVSNKIKAIVLTCDKNISIANHTICTYDKLWTNHPFIFRVPYSLEYPNFLKDNYGEKIELIKTEAPIKPTVLSLLTDLDDEEWIYWCMDDRYLVKIRLLEVNCIYEYVKNNHDPDVVSIRLIRMNRSYTTDKFMKKDGDIIINKYLTLKESIFSDWENLEGLWQPQFLRVKLLKRVFTSFPDRDFRAKEMDSFPKLKLKGEKLYIPEKNLIVVGESTHRGELTENCASSFKKYKLEIPIHLNITKKYMIQGKLPYQFLGFEFTLPQKIQRLVTSIYRWYWRNQKY
jgi:hypothetical protein